jgi:hypothetical protein
MLRWLSVALAALGVVISIAACATPPESTASDEGADTTGNGPSLYRPGNRFSGWSNDGTTDQYLDEVQPILAKRCVGCHGCTTSPCQLKLSSYEGVQRGANTHNVFSVGLFSSPDGPTRMKDATTEAQWRAKSFYSVLDGGKDSVMYRYLQHGEDNNTAGFDLTNAYGLYKGKVESLKFECSGMKKAAMDARVAKPGTGMPFGLTQLPNNEYATLTKWLEAGAPGPSAAAQAALLAPRDANTVQAWEDFFNDASSPKNQLAMRYIFEHLFNGHMHFDDSQASKGDFFEVVRATSQTGPISEIVTETPSDDPKQQFYYRFKKVTQIITAKDHTVWHLTDAVKSHWSDLFLNSDWSIDTLPGYDGGNPFVIFDPIPGKIRDQFMIENSQKLIEAMVKGDVCNGSSATYAIRDRFWTFFLKPDSDPSAADPKLGNTDYSHLDPNTSSGSANASFTSLFEARMKELKPNGLTEQDLWDGDKTDKNAWITVFRHGKSASAHYGPLGQMPETLWVLDYANFERLYYDLVVLFKVWSKATDQIGTWRTMSNVRAHGEDLFLMFMPEDQRDALRLQFTPGVLRFTETPMMGAGIPAGNGDLDATKSIPDFVSRIQKYMGTTIAPIDALNPDTLNPAAPGSDLESQLFGLTIQRGQYSDMLPEITWVTIDNNGQKLDYTLLANRIYWSNSRIIGDFLGGVERRPELDSISVVKGHIGAFPELFLEVPIAEAAAAIQSGKTSKQARLAVRAKYEVPRNSPRFWQFIDDEHSRQLANNPLDSGIVDISEYLWPVSLQSTEKEPLSSN